MFLFGLVQAQDSTTSRRSAKQSRKEEKRQKINSMIRQEEEGVLSYNKQSVFGVQVRSNGYGVFYELGRMRTPRFTNIYMVELTEIKKIPEYKDNTIDGGFGNTFISGKINNFYQLKFGFGQQYIFGQKGNKNGVAVMGVATGGLSLGLLRPYYLRINDDGVERTIKYSQKDSALFVGGATLGSGGFSKGWSELKLKPGVFVKGGLRFDFGRYNEIVQALEIGFSVDAYAQKVQLLIPIADNDPNRLYYQAHIAFLFGRRK